MLVDFLLLVVAESITFFRFVIHYMRVVKRNSIYFCLVKKSSTLEKILLIYLVSILITLKMFNVVKHGFVCFSLCDFQSETNFRVDCLK